MNFARQRFHLPRLTRAGAYLAEQLEANGKPVISRSEFFRIVQTMYRESSGKGLFLRRSSPDRDDLVRFRAMLKSAGAIASDRDYGFRVIRVLHVPDQPADDIVCLVDRTCHVAFLSAMQRWSLTNRAPFALMLARPGRGSVKSLGYRKDEAANNPYGVSILRHPTMVRRRKIDIYENKNAGHFQTIPDSPVRVSTVGQTFLDMLQRPKLCGGMYHVLDVWEEHAEAFLDQIVAVIDETPTAVIKSRAGYILEERLGLHHPSIETWKTLGQRGGSRKLNPDRDYAPAFSETWKLSLNV